MTESAPHRLWLPGALPDLNDIIDAAKGCGGKGLGYSRLKKQHTETIAWRAKAARIPPMQAARFRFTWCEVDKRRNPDNVAAAKKFIFDGLVLAKVLTNDGWSQVRGWVDSFGAGAEPGVLVEIWPEEKA